MAASEREIREETPADILGITAAHNAAFGRSNEAVLVEQLRKEGVIAASFVAVEQGRVVGNVVFSQLSMFSSGDAISAVALAPVAVLPDYQLRGIGSGLIRSGLALCKLRGYDAVLVLGSFRYYGRFGFSPNLARNVHSPYSDLGDHWMALELRSGSLSGRSLEATYPAAFHEVD
ncbi:MAG: N-acetyltransferase [Candidatus Eremiobacteraeota bacterium]|nr:N-acetyltransferase [Candidatus Eremiobacteraeota bacterium]